MKSTSKGPMQFLQKCMGSHDIDFSSRHTQKIVMQAASFTAFAMLAGVHLFKLCDHVKRQNHSPMQNKIEHFQHCFERLLEHSW